jgi:hypothetical protein
MNKMIALAGAFLAFALCAASPASAQEGMSETRRFSGVYVNGWETQLFVENGRESERPYWIAISPEARASLAAVLPAHLEAGEGVRVVISFDGRLSPPGRYGHLGVYPHTVVVDHVISARLEGRPTAFCDAEASGVWPSAGGQNFLVTATTSGPTCRQSVALLIVRDTDGNVVWTDARAAAHVMGLSTPETRSPMAGALQAWIADGARGQTTADLPPWPRAAEPPVTPSGFEFAPESWIDRALYLEIRARADPMFCYVQGMESLACLFLHRNRIEKIGIQSFPG